MIGKEIKNANLLKVEIPTNDKKHKNQALA